MSKHDDGGPASEETLWDEYAKEAMKGLCANDSAMAGMIQQSWGENMPGAKVLARVCGQFADAMIAEKRRREGTDAADSANTTDN